MKKTKRILALVLVLPFYSIWQLVFTAGYLYCCLVASHHNHDFLLPVAFMISLFTVYPKDG